MIRERFIHWETVHAQHSLKIGLDYCFRPKSGLYEIRNRRNIECQPELVDNISTCKAHTLSSLPKDLLTGLIYPIKIALYFQRANIGSHKENAKTHRKVKIEKSKLFVSFVSMRKAGSGYVYEKIMWQDAWQNIHV